MLSRLLASLLLITGTVLSQSVAWTDTPTGIPFQSFLDPVHGIRLSIAFPASTSSTEFVGEIIAPISAKWVGWSLGGGMNYNLLLVAWPWNGAIVPSTRYALGYSAPFVITGPTVTTIAAGSFVNATHWKWLFRCQNCTTWADNSLNTNGYQVFGWALGLTAVSAPANPASSITDHEDFGLWAHDTASAHFSNYNDFLDDSV
ncbi:CBD9-like protein [Ceratobasidium sp. AG-I]|nr:CBD9-like protein [Ceratobasidium sp. AG-I]